MFKVIVADGKQELPDDDIYYIVAKEGIFIKKKLGIMDSVSPVKNISILESVKATAKMNIEKIPSLAVAKIANFFRHVYKEHKSEAIVLLFYNEESKKYKLVPPSQKVSPASIEYNRSVIIDGFTMIGDIHSHSSMSAFHSGTDQGDEESFDGLHITFGNLGDEMISISASIVSNGNRVMVEPEQYMKGVSLESKIDEVEKIPTTRIYRWVNGAMVEQTPKYSTKSYKTIHKFDKRYKIISQTAIKAIVPPKWIKAVEHGFSPYGQYGQAWRNVWEGNYQNGRWNRGKWIPPQYSRGWNENFDPDVWALNKKDEKIPPQNVGVKVDPIKFPPHNQGPVITDITPEKRNACETCPFKDRAFEYVASRLVKENKGTIVEEEEKGIWDEKEVYECMKCNVVVSFDFDDNGDVIGDIICPECKSNDHLIELDMEEDSFDDEMKFDLDPYAPDSKPGSSLHCESCNSDFDASMLRSDVEKGAKCPFCETSLFNAEDLNYVKENDEYVCKGCSTMFTYDLIKNDCCPFCKEPLILKGHVPGELLNPDSEKIEQVSKEEIHNYQAAKENPHPADIIPDPSEKRQRINPIEWLNEKLGRNK
jgi:PRTRC genetic system protein A